MSVGPMVSVAASLAGSSLGQSRGSDVERAQQDSVQLERRVAGELKAEQAAGIGVTDQEHEASDRDADGRRLWEGAAKSKAEKEKEQEQAAALDRKSRDATGECGTQLDLSG
jgi:membrane protein involved in colicin uptake